MHNDILDFNAEDQPTERYVEYASFWSRVGASILDTLIFIPLIALSLYNSLSLKSLLLFLVISLISLLYKTVFEYVYSASLGKMALKLKVIGEEGAKISLQQAIIRNIFFILVGVLSFLSGLYLFMQPDFEKIRSFLAFSAAQEESPYALITQVMNLILLVSCVFVAFRDNRQALHDSMAGTYVIKR